MDNAAEKKKFKGKKIYVNTPHAVIDLTFQVLLGEDVKRNIESTLNLLLERTILASLLDDSVILCLR